MIHIEEFKMALRTVLQNTETFIVLQEQGNETP